MTKRSTSALVRRASKTRERTAHVRVEERDVLVVDEQVLSCVEPAVLLPAPLHGQSCDAAKGDRETVRHTGLNGAHWADCETCPISVVASTWASMMSICAGATSRQPPSLREGTRRREGGRTSGALRPRNVPSVYFGPGCVSSSGHVQWLRRWPGRKLSAPKLGSPSGPEMVAISGRPLSVWLGRVPTASAGGEVGQRRVRARGCESGSVPSQLSYE